MATLYDVAHFCSWNGYPQDMKGYLGIDKASWANQEFWFPYGVNALYGKRQKTRLQALCENIWRYKYPNCPPIRERIQELLANGAKPDIKDLTGMSPLLVSARGGYLDTVKILLNAGSDINQINNDGFSALCLSTRHNKIDIVKELIKNGTKHLDSSLHISICSKNLELVKILLNAGANINTQKLNGYSILHYASVFNEIAIIKELVERGAHINIMTIHGTTPMSIAVSEGHLSIVKYLYEHGATVSEDSFEILIDKEYIDILKYFKKVGLHVPARLISHAVYENKPKFINLLSKMGGDLNYIDENMDTPLSTAMYDKSYECMEALCKAGANMNMLDLRTNSSHIKTTIVRGDSKALQILLDNGVNINSIIHDSYLLHYALLLIHIYPADDLIKTCVKEIIKRAPDFTLINQSGQDAFEIAKEYGLDDIAVCIKRAILAGKQKKTSRPHK